MGAAETIHRLSGTFADRDLEAAFRAATTADETIRLQITIGLSLLAVPVFLGGLYARLGWGDSFALLAGLRGIVALVQIGLLIRLWRPHTVWLRDVSALMMVTAVFFGFCVTVVVTPDPGIGLALLPFALGVGAMVLGIGHPRNMAIAISILMALYVTLFALSPGVTLPERIAFAGVTAFIMAGGWYYRCQWEAYQRRLWRQSHDLETALAEARAARTAAEKASAAKSTFLATMSHEIRTPLNGILGMTQVLLARTPEGDLRNHLETIDDSGRMLSVLLNDVLDMAKIEAGKLDIAPEPSDLRVLLDRTLALWRPEAESKGLALILDLAPGLPNCLTFDPVRVRQCVSNLLSNAVKFTARGSVRLAATYAKGMVRITVSDTGIGMDQATCDRLFAPFTQADSTTARRFGGSGLGLSICRQLADLMGGSVTVESAPEQGSTFTLLFKAPLATLVEPDTGAELDTRSDAPAGSVLWAQDLRVLLVDDNLVNRQVVRLFLEPRGAIVTEAENGRLALDALAQQPFDVMLLDMHMPVLDGRETVRAIRTAHAPWRGLPVIALTADTLDRDALDALGFDDHVMKPVRFDALAKAINAVRAWPAHQARAVGAQAAVGAAPLAALGHPGS